MLPKKNKNTVRNEECSLECYNIIDIFLMPMFCFNLCFWQCTFSQICTFNYQNVQICVCWCVYVLLKWNASQKKEKRICLKVSLLKYTNTSSTPTLHTVDTVFSFFTGNSYTHLAQTFMLSIRVLISLVILVTFHLAPPVRQNLDSSDTLSQILERENLERMLQPARQGSCNRKKHLNMFLNPFLLVL